MRDEQAEHEAFEQLVGGPTRGFRLLRIYEAAGSPRDRFTDSSQRASREARFLRMALQAGFTKEQAQALLELQ